MIIFSESKSFFTTPSASSLIMIYMLLNFQCITRSLLLSIEKVKLCAILLIEFSMCQIF